MKYKLVLLISSLLIITSVHAQWHFTANINVNCGNIYDSQVQLAQELSAIPFSTKQECESARQSITINVSYGGCYARITATPCTGSDLGGASSTSVTSIQSSTAIGEPYFAPNGAYVVSNTGRDMEIKMEALSKSINDAIGGIKTKDKPFDDLYKKQANALPKTKNKNDNNGNVYTFNSRKGIDPDKPVYVRMFDTPVLEENYYRDKPNLENVQQYLRVSENLTGSFLANQQNMESILQNEFERVSGINLTEILNKHPNDRTQEEKQILTDYGAFKTAKIEEMYKELNVSIDNTKEKNVVDAAILALDVYGDDKDGYINKTNYTKIDIETLLSSNNLSNNNPISDIAFAIKTCNDTQNDTGFHVELYYNENTNTYVISCAGTEKEELLNDAIVNDGSILLNLLGGTTEVAQYNMAKTIGDAINRIPQELREQLNLEVVGHSLGGGIASIIGLTTGIETKTFNAATVPENVLKKYGLYEKVDNGEVKNITAYHTSTDILTKAQEAIGSPAIGTSVNIGDPATPSEKETARTTGTIVGTAIGGAIGNYYGDDVGEMVAGHKMPAMTREIYESKMKREYSDLKKMNDAKTRLQDELNHIERLKQGF